MTRDTRGLESLLGFHAFRLVRWEPRLSVGLLFLQFCTSTRTTGRQYGTGFSCLVAHYRKMVVNSRRYIVPVCARKVFLVGVLRELETTGLEFVDDRSMRTFSEGNS